MKKERYELINVDAQTVSVTMPMDEIDAAISNQEFRMLHKRDSGPLLQWFKQSDRVLEKKGRSVDIDIIDDPVQDFRILGWDVFIPPKRLNIKRNNPFEIEFFDQEKSMIHTTPKFKLYSIEEEMKLSGILCSIAIWIEENPKQILDVNELRLVKGNETNRTI